MINIESDFKSATSNYLAIQDSINLLKKQSIQGIKQMLLHLKKNEIDFFRNHINIYYYGNKAIDSISIINGGSLIYKTEDGYVEDCSLLKYEVLYRVYQSIYHLYFNK